MNAVRLSALGTGRLYLQEMSLLFISVKIGVQPRATVRPEQQLIILNIDVTTKAKCLC